MTRANLHREVVHTLLLLGSASPERDHHMLYIVAQRGVREARVRRAVRRLLRWGWLERVHETLIVTPLGMRSTGWREVLEERVKTLRRLLAQHEMHAIWRVVASEYDVRVRTTRALSSPELLRVARAMEQARIPVPVLVEVEVVPTDTLRGGHPLEMEALDAEVEHEPTGIGRATLGLDEEPTGQWREAWDGEGASYSEEPEEPTELRTVIARTVGR